MTDIKDRIAAIDGYGRALAAAVNERIVEERLLGQSPATIRRVEELINTEIDRAGMEPDVDPDDVDVEAFEFTIMRGGIAKCPLVTVARYTGRVGL